MKGFEAIRLARATAATGLVEEIVVEKGPRCPACGRKWAEYVPRPYRISCPRCKVTVVGPAFRT